jgi:hypothetical protein
MKPNRLENNQPHQNAFTAFCADYCRKLLTEIQRTKQDLVNQFRKAFSGQEQLLRLALNEAEALAFLTDYPHLVFPDLAMEKVQSAANWSAHQRQVGWNPTAARRF